MCNFTPLLTLALTVSCAAAKFQCQGPGFFADPESCTAFYRCVNKSTSYRYICPLGTRYDPTVSNCNHAFLAPPCHIQTSGTVGSGSSTAAGTQESNKIEGDDDGDQGTSGQGSQETSGQQSAQDLGQPTDQSAGDTINNESSQQSGQTTGGLGSGESGQDSLLSGLGDGEVNQSTSSTPINVNPITDIDIPNQTQPPLTRPTAAAATITTTTTSTPPATTTSTTASDQSSSTPQYTLSPQSIYPCTEPGFFKEASNCKDFYMCKEISPGVLSAERLFRCPDRYLFDPQSRLCQRREKVDCNEEVVYNLLRSSFVSQLSESQLESFFAQSLTLPERRKPLPRRPAQLSNLIPTYVNPRLQTISGHHPSFQLISGGISLNPFLPAPVYSFHG